ncbi:MAG: hypothetical protein GY866_19250 [Proteobacteria bacterium]|nr:hypothetical protein [Pseudomonadota bacterium]
MIESGGKESDWKKRTEMYHEMEKAIYENYEDVWLWWRTSVEAYRKNVHGWNADMYVKYGALYARSHLLWFKDGRQ